MNETQIKAVERKGGCSVDAAAVSIEAENAARKTF